MVTDMDKLTERQRKFVAMLLKYGVKEETLALMLMLIPTEKEQKKLSDHLVKYLDQIISEGVEIVEDMNGVVLEYLMELMKEE